MSAADFERDLTVLIRRKMDDALELAATIAKLMDGESLMCKIDEITGGFETRDGDTAAYGVVLEIEVPVAE